MPARSLRERCAVDPSFPRIAAMLSLSAAESSCRLCPSTACALIRHKSASKTNDFIDFISHVVGVAECAFDAAWRKDDLTSFSAVPTYALALVCIVLCLFIYRHVHLRCSERHENASEHFGSI